MEFPARNGDMLHNQRKKSKGENFFILLFLLQGMMQVERQDYMISKTVLFIM
jgi:hypothetical protein